MLNNLSIRQALAVFLGTSSSFIIYLTFKQYLRLRRYKHIPNPQTKGLLGFFSGNYVELSEAAEKDIGFAESSIKWFKELGSIYKIYFFDQIIVAVNGAEAVKKVVIDLDLHKNDTSYNILAYPFKSRALGKGLVTQIDKEKWKKSRALFNHGFQRSVLMQCFKEFDDKANIVMEKLRSQADGKKLVTLFPEINKFALDVISAIAFGFNNDSINENRNYLNSLVIDLLQGLNDAMVDPLIEFKPSKKKLIREFKKSLAELRNFSRNHIQQRIKDIENKDYVPNDILTIIINNFEGDSFDIEDLIDEFLTFFIAGQETVANSLAFAILELGQNCEAFTKLREEVDTVIGSKPHISNDDLSQLEYTNCVFKETLRKWPPAPEFSRRTYEEIEINGVRIPKNTWIMLSPYVSGRNSEYFPEPEKFIPDRFDQNSEFSKLNMVNSYTYFPFSLGPRNCIGQNFAKMEAKIFLAKFVQNFDFRLDETQSFAGKELLTLRPKDGCRIYLTQRSS
nr:cytochrome p450 CYP3049A4 [Brachionus calyciflorus]